MMLRASRRAGSATLTAAMTTPTATAAPDQMIVADGGAELRCSESHVADECCGASPSAEPMSATKVASAMPSPTSWRVVAPRVRSRACSRRRRSRPDAATAAVSSPASTAPGAPRKRNSTCAYKASLRALARVAPRLSPTSPLPARCASRLRAAPVTSL